MVRFDCLMGSTVNRGAKGGSMGYIDRHPYNVIVVGAASGIGKTTAQFLAREGVHVACLDRDGESAKATADGIASTDNKSFSLAVEVTDPASVEQAVTQAAGRLGQIHGLVNCAGITGKTNVKGHEVELADFDR